MSDANTTIALHSIGDGTPSSQNPTQATAPWARGTMIIDCSTPFTVLVRWSMRLRLLPAGEGRDAADDVPDLVPVAQQEEQHHQEDRHVEERGGQPGEDDLQVVVRLRGDAGQDRARGAAWPSPPLAWRIQTASSG